MQLKGNLKLSFLIAFLVSYRILVRDLSDCKRTPKPAEGVFASVAKFKK
jgi:hypothetical protein